MSSDGLEWEPLHPDYGFAVQPAYPNPFNPQAELKYSLHEASQVNLAVFSIRGELVKNLVSASREPGEYEMGPTLWTGQRPVWGELEPLPIT